MSGNKSGYINNKELAMEAAREALKLFKKDEKEKARRKSLYNVGLLMDHYLDFIDHYEKIKYRASDIIDDMDPEERGVIYTDDIYILSIKRSKIRTKIMISQIETAVAILEASMKQKNESEKCEVIKKLYMDRNKIDIKFNQRVKEVAEELKCGESSVRRWNSEMLNELSVKLFGVDGLRLDV